MKLKFLLAFFLLSISLFSYRPLKYAQVGTRLTAQGLAGGAMIDAPEAVLYNPAALVGFSWNEIFYEFDTSLLLDAFRWDYKFAFDAVSFAGGVFPLKKNKNIVMAGTIATLFEGSTRLTSRFSVRQFGYSLAYKFNPRVFIGATLGFILGHDYDINTDARNFSFSGSATFGMLFIPYSKVVARTIKSRRSERVLTNYRNRSYIVGFSVSSPIYLRWDTYRGANTVDELLPFTARLANTFYFNKNFRLFWDLEYQGWVSAFYKEDGYSRYLDRSPYSFGKSIHPHIGIEIYDMRGKLLGRRYAGGIYRVGLTTRSSITALGENIRRVNLTFGMTVFAGNYFRVSFSIVDSLIVEGMLVLAEKISRGRYVREGYAITEQIRLGVEMDLSVFTAEEKGRGRRPANVRILKRSAPRRGPPQRRRRPQSEGNENGENTNDDSESEVSDESNE